METPVEDTEKAHPVGVKDGSVDSREGPAAKRPLSKRILAVVWDSLDKTPEERSFIAKIDWWILSYCCIAYFVKYLDQTNVSNVACDTTSQPAFPVGKAVSDLMVAC